MRKIMKDAMEEWDRVCAEREAKAGKPLDTRGVTPFRINPASDDEQLTAFELGVGRFHNGVGK